MTDPSTRPTRRQLLASVGAGSAAGLAGCSAILDDDGEDSAGDQNGDGGGDGDEGTWEEGGPPDREDWTVTFQDEFSAGELDRSVWRNGFGEYPLLCPHHGPNHCAVEENSWVEDGRLVTAATEDTPELPPEEDWDGRNHQPEYSIGSVNTEGSFEQEFGYFEARTRAEVGPGTLPAFWLFLNIDEHRYREIDVMELFGEEYQPAFTHHVDCEGDGENESESGDHRLETAASERFHTWGCEWSPEHLAFSVDGEEVHRVTGELVTECLPGQPLYLLVGHGVSGPAAWIGDPGAAEFPLVHEVEWVRAWQHERWRS